MHDPNSFGCFSEASHAVLDHLHESLGFDLWMVTRTEGKDWIVLEAVDNGYGVARGDVFRWTDSFCSRMVEGLGPRIAPCSDDIAAYASAPIGQQVDIGAYVGVPLSWHDGRLFGTLCAINPTPRPQQIVAQQPLVELFARLLSSVLQAEIKATEQTRLAERAATEAMTDGLTGLYNRRGWDRLIAAEEARCKRYGHPACLISIDVDRLKEVNDTRGHTQGDHLIRATANAISSTLREQDVAGRIGGDEFAVIAVECDRAGADDLATRLRRALTEHSVMASMGVAMCEPSRSFSHSWELADAAMYQEKRQRSPEATVAAAAIPSE